MTYLFMRNMAEQGNMNVILHKDTTDHAIIFYSTKKDPPADPNEIQ